MRTETKDLAHYEKLPYTVTIRRDDEGDFVARVAELPGCVAHGDSQSSALENLSVVQRLWIEEALSAGNEIPEPEQDPGMPSGKWIQRVPRRLHKQLANAAKQENVSLNQLVTSMLSESLAVRNCARNFDVFFAHRMPQPAHQMRDALALMWWPGHQTQHAQGVRGWATTPGPYFNNISAVLARVRKIGSTNEVEVADEERIKEHLREQLVGR
jgi:predicted RNase H-like HicB family nuclease